jgi:feruloyl-CoA synthase
MIFNESEMAAHFAQTAEQSAAGRYRPVRLGSLTATLERRPDGSLLVRSRQPLGPYPRCATERLVHWATTTPDRHLLEWRATDGSIARLTYAEAYDAVRCLGQALLDRGVTDQRPLVILSGNGVEHALLTLAALHVGACCAPISPAYSLVSRDFCLLKQALSRVSPCMAFADDGQQFDQAIRAAVPDDAEIVVAKAPPASRPATMFAKLMATEPTGAVDAAYRRIDSDTVAKILFTSGSTGVPRGVINTHRMLTSNQQMIAQVLPFLADEPPVLVDWLPWHHTFGGNHNFGLVVHHGGCLFIDEGKPLPGAFDRTVRNLREVAPTLYMNVPLGFEELVRALRHDAALRQKFFSRLRLMFYAAASLAQHVADEFQAIAVQTCGKRIVLTTALGATETAPMATVRPWESDRAGSIGLPVPGLDAKLVKTDDKLEMRVRGPNVTPGYWHAPELTRDAFDDEGFYRLGDAVRFVDADDVNRGLLFDGRIAEDFKLASGTWVNVGPMRAQVIAFFAPFLRDVVITGHDRDDVGMIIIPDVDVCRNLCPDLPPSADMADVLRHPAVYARFKALLEEFATRATGSANRIARAVLLHEPPLLDTGEVTDKGSLNQRAILSRRVEIVQSLYASDPPPCIITLGSA